MVSIWKFRAPSSTSGFTLIELMVAACLMGVAAVGLSSIFHNGLRLWAHSEIDMKVDQEARTVLEQIGRDFRNSIDVPGAGWSVKDGGVSFSTLRDVSVDPIHDQPTEKIVQVHYGQNLTTAPGEMVWEYAYRSSSGAAAVQWEKDWTRTDSLPAGIRVTLTLYDQNASSQTYTRTFFSPTRELFPWQG